MKVLIQTINQSTQTTNKSMQEMKRFNSQIVEELKNATMTNTRDIQGIQQAITKIEGQIGQLANHVGEREREKFSSQPMPNPKGQFGIGSSFTPTHGQEHMLAITTLRSGKQVDNQVAKPEETTKTAKEEES